MLRHKLMLLISLILFLTEWPCTLQTTFVLHATEQRASPSRAEPEAACEIDERGLSLEQLDKEDDVN